VRYFYDPTPSLLGSAFEFIGFMPPTYVVWNVAMLLNDFQSRCTTIAMLMECGGLEFLYKTSFNFLAIDCDEQSYLMDGDKNFDAHMQTGTQTHLH
jgi:hypothetical protein